MIAAAREANLRHRPAVRATRPPTASCHARVGNEKNATNGTTWVTTNDSAKDPAEMRASMVRKGRGEEVASVLVRRRIMRISHAVKRINAGHTR